MAFKTGLFGGTKGRWIMRVVIDIVMTGGTGIFQLFDMETVRNRDIIGIDLRRSTFHIKNTWMATDAVRIDLVKFGGKPGMLSIAFKRKDVNARHQGMSGGMTFRAVDSGMHG